MSKERKAAANKGFSLVELIIVVAIMAILGVVVAPSYMKYVEKTKFTKDNDAVNAVKTAVDVALADEAVYTEVAKTTENIVITFSDTGYSWTNPVTDLKDEVEATIAAADAKITSKTYIKATNKPTITIDKSTMEVTITNQLDAPTE